MGQPRGASPCRHVVRPSPEVLSEFRRRAARRDLGNDDLLTDGGAVAALPEMCWFAEGILTGLWGDDGVRVVEGVTRGLGRRDWVDAFHTTLALVLRRRASQLRPSHGPLVGRMCTASPPRGFPVGLLPIRRNGGASALSEIATRRLLVDAGDAVWCDGDRGTLEAFGARSL